MRTHRTLIAVAIIAATVLAAGCTPSPTGGGRPSESTIVVGVSGAYRMVETLDKALPDDAPFLARDLVAMSFAFSLGWLLLRELIQAATGAGDDVPEKWFSAMAAVLGTS